MTGTCIWFKTEWESACNNIGQQHRLQGHAPSELTSFESMRAVRTGTKFTKDVVTSINHHTNREED